MPVNTSPEALDAFDALDDNDKSSLIDELDDNDAHSLTEAMLSHRQSKATVGPPTITNVVPDAGTQPEAVVTQPPAPQQPLGILDRVQQGWESAKTRASQAGSPFDFSAGASYSPMAPIHNIDAAKAAFVDPAVRAIQENVVRPVVNFGINKGKELGITPDVPAGELLYRSAVQWMAGSGVMDDMDEDKKLKAVNDLEQISRHPIAKAFTGTFDAATAALPKSVQDYLPNTPEKRAAFAMSLADQAGQAPLLFVGGGKVGQFAGKGATAISRVAGHMASGALAMSTVALVQPGQKLSEAAVSGALLGGVPAAAGEALGAAVRGVSKRLKVKPEVVGVGTSGWVDDTIQELSQPLTPTERQAVISKADALSAELSASKNTVSNNFTPVKYSDPTFKPGMAYVIPNAEERFGFVGRLTQVVDGQARVYEHPINTADDARAFYKMAQDKGSSAPLLDKSLQNLPEFSDEMAEALGITDRQRFIAVTNGKSNAPPTAQPLPLDSPPADLGNPNVLILKDADGLRVEPLDPTHVEGPTVINANADVPEGGTMIGGKPRDFQPTQAGASPPTKSERTPPAPPSQPPAPPFRPPDEPPGVPPPGPGDLPDDALNVAKNIQGMVQAETKTPGVFDKILRQLVGSHVRGPKDLAQLAAIQKGVKHLESSGIETIKALQRNFGKKLMTDLDKDLMSLAKASTEADRLKLSADMSAKSYGPMWEKHKSKVHELLRERDLLDQMVSALGGVPDELAQARQAGQIDAYVARSFMAYILPPGRWAEIVKRDQGLMDRGIAWLRSENGLQPGDTSMDGDLQAKLLEIIGSEDPFTALKDPKYGIKSAQHLKKREDLSPVLRELLGENTSGIVAIGQSLGAQRAIASNLMMWREIAVRPDWCLPTLADNKQLADMGWKKLPENRRWYGDAAGKYINPQVYDTMVTLPNAIENSKFLFHGLMSYVKANEVALGGAGPWLNNTVANIFSSIKAGGIDPLGSPIASGRALKRAAEAMLAFRENPSALHGDANLIFEARRMGVEAPGYHGTEVDPLQRQLADRLMKQYASGGDKSFFSFLRTFGDAAKKVRTPFGIAFDQNDRFFKLANWIALYEKFKAAPERYLPGVAPHGVDEAAKRLAAYRVNRSFQAADKLGPAVDKIRKGAPGVLAKYWTPFAEDLRIAGDIPAHVAEEPELALRLFKYTAAMGAIVGTNGMARRMSGIPDEEVDAALALQKGQRHGPDFMHWALPWRDSKGRAQVWDLTPHVPIAKFFEGSLDQGMFSKILVNAGLQASSGGAGEDIVSGVAAQAGVPGMKDKSFIAPRPGEEGVLKALDFAWNNLSLGPKAVTKEYDILKRYGALGGVPNTTEQFTGGQAVARTMGARVEPFTLPGAGPSPTGYAAVKAAVGMLGQLRGQIPGIAQMPDDQAMAMLPQLLKSLEGDPRRFKDVRLKATIEQIKQVLGKLKTQGEAVRKARAAQQVPPSIFPK